MHDGLLQNDRLLVLSTVLQTPELAAENVEIDEAIGPLPSGGVGYRMVVHALCVDAHLELKSLIGQPVLLALLTSASRTTRRPFHGHVTEAAQVGSDGGLARYRLVVEPWLAFLARRRDAYVFQDRSVIAIVEEVFADYRGEGRLMPAWRWDLADPSVYAVRSVCIQYQETDLDFVMRLLREEGLFCWFEHAGDAQASDLGTHTLVIADHNGAFRPNDQATVRFTQASAVQPEDSLGHWRRRATVQSASVGLASLDYRSSSLRPQGEQTGLPIAALPELKLDDVPGAYAYETMAQGARLAACQMEALDALREQAEGRGTVRTSAPGTTFTLTDHPVHDGGDESRDRFVMLGVRHRARNNLHADAKAGLGAFRLDPGFDARNDPERNGDRDPERGADRLSGRSAASALDRSGADAAAPLYESRILAQRAAVPVRLAATDAAGRPDPRLHPRPSVHGVQTAIVVGSGSSLRTDRDQRIKVQFHWQRGSRSSHRLDHSGGSNAPANDASGTWVRVAQSVAGANWGAVFTPRLGQEVLVQFIAGDIDRPVVIGSVYNGQGSLEAQGNQRGGGAAGASANAAAWFVGSAKGGDGAPAEDGIRGHRHPPVLAGYKSQELRSSAAGNAGANQLVFDDGDGRIELASTQAQTRLQLGHLLDQSDNRLLQARGHGLDLTSAAWGAVRAGAGLLVSAHAQPGSQSAGRALESREPRTQLEQSQQLLHGLAERAQQQKAKGVEPDIAGAGKGERMKRLRNEQALYASLASLEGNDQRSGAAESGADAVSADAVSAGANSGGSGSVTAWLRPDFVVAAPGAIAAFTPAAALMSAGNTFTLVASQDLQYAVQGNQAAAVRRSLVFYTDGKAGDGAKPNTETGISMHAASGSVALQSQRDGACFTADKGVGVSSTGAMVRITAPQHILMTAAGAALDLQPGSITLKGPGKVEFHASLKELSGPGSANQQARLKAADVEDCPWLVD